MRRWLRKLTRRARLEREMRDELAFHVQARAEDLARSGMPEAEALRQARIEFGGVESYKEQLRETRRFAIFEDTARDLAYAWRNLRRSPVFTISAAAAIALGIGVNTTLFSLVYGVLFRPLPVRNPETIRNVYMSTRGPGGRKMYGTQYFLSFDEYRSVRSQSRTAELAAVAEAGATARFAPAGLHLQLASDNLLPMIGARPVIGRFFTRDEAATPGMGAVAVLSYDAWQKYFNGEQVAGRSVVLNRTPFTIVGVADEHSYGPLVLKPDLWIPLTMQAVTRAGEPLIADANAGWLQVIGRLKPGVTDAALRAELQVLAQQAVTAHAPQRQATVTIAPGAFLNYPDVMQGSVPVLAILFLAVSLVLVVACANVANMLLARGFGRSREIAIRLSIGAGKGRLVRQLLTEHLLLGVLGGLAGLALSQLAVRGLMSVLPTIGGNQISVSADASIAVWTLLVALMAGLMFGVPSALGMVRGGLMNSLRGDGPSGLPPGSRTRLQSALIAIQVAVSAVLLINAGLLLRAMGTAAHLDTGQANRNVLIAKVNLRDLQYTPDQAARFLNQFRSLAVGSPGVTGAALTGFEPLMTSCGSRVRPIDSKGIPGEWMQVNCNETSPEYLKVMQIPLRQGRTFQAKDAAPAAKVVLIDEGFARRIFARNALGRRLRMGDTPSDDYEIVGVVATTKPLNLVTGEYPQVYQPLEGIRYLEARLVVGFAGPAAPLRQSLQTIAAQLDRDVTVSVRPIEENVETAIGLVRLAAAGVAALGGLALLLACTGVYGVVAFAVARRGREIGVRLALGAPPASVARLLVRQSMRPVVLGGVIGAALAAAGAQLIRAMLYGVSPLDPLSFVGALAFLGAVAAVAALAPARTALRVDPAVTLRHE
jgi:putative ABC transport system permease protein